MRRWFSMPKRGAWSFTFSRDMTREELDAASAAMDRAFEKMDEAFAEIDKAFTAHTNEKQDG